MKWLDTLVLTVPVEPVDPDLDDEYGDQALPSPTEEYSGECNAQPQSHRMNLQLSGDDEVKAHDRIFIPRGGNVEAFSSGADAVLTRGKTSQQLTGDLVGKDALSNSVMIRWRV